MFCTAFGWSECRGVVWAGGGWFEEPRFCLSVTFSNAIRLPRPMFPQYKMSLPFSMSNTLNNCPQTVKKLQLLGNCCAEEATSVKCVWNNDCCSVTVMGCGFIYTWCITVMLPAVLGAELRFGWVQAAPQPSCKWVLWLFYASSLSGVWPECSLYFF